MNTNFRISMTGGHIGDQLIPQVAVRPFGRFCVLNFSRRTILELPLLGRALLHNRTFVLDSLFVVMKPLRYFLSPGAPPVVTDLGIDLNFFFRVQDTMAGHSPMAGMFKILLSESIVGRLYMWRGQGTVHCKRFV